MQAERFLDSSQHTRLLLSVAEQLKVPLTVMTRRAELAEVSDRDTLEPVFIHAQSQMALTLVDNYLLGLQLLAQQEELELEPVSVSSTLVDATYVLREYAQQYGVGIDVKIAGRYGPVMAHHTGLRAALLSLGFALIEAVGTQGQKQPRRLTLATHRTPHGIVAGWYGVNAITAEQWRKALKLQGKAQQPLGSLLAGSGAGVFVADALSRAMATRLRVGHHERQTGLVLTLQPSQQLQLV